MKTAPVHIDLHAAQKDRTRGQRRLQIKYTIEFHPIQLVYLWLGTPAKLDQ
ncbi:uncharacterized, partial [Tachysurus ichikawai]